MVHGYSMDEKKIRAGTRMLFNPVPASFPIAVLEQIQVAVVSTTGISDAYLTRCNLPSEASPRWVLVVGVEGVSVTTAANRVMDLLDDLVLDDNSIDVLPFQSGTIPPAVLHTGRKIA